MALPKTLIRLFKPYIVLLTGGMIYLAAAQLERMENSAREQSASNIRIGNSIIRSNIEATFGKLYLLETSLEQGQTTSKSAFIELSENILKRTPNFSDIVLYHLDTKQYLSSRGLSLPSSTLNSLTWHRIDSVAEDFYISSVYQKTDGRWVFAVKHTISDRPKEIWIEFDLLHTTQGLRDLKTLNNGYIFVVDRSTERLIFHPDPTRVGTKSISFHAGISHQLSLGQTSGQHEYYYQDHFKVSVYDADNSLNWVFIAGTDRQDILTSSHQFTLTAIVLGSLLLLWIVANYLIHRLNLALSLLNQVDDIAGFKRQLKSVINHFCYNKGIQFCLYDSTSHAFSTIDYHGNKRIVHTNQSLAQSLLPDSLTYRNGNYADSLARSLKITERHYCIPLHSRKQLLAVLYINSTFPISRSILRMVRSATETSLANLLLHHQLSCKDLMTQLDNKNNFNAALASHLNEPDTFVALLDIDHFEHLNNAYGETIGDSLIKNTAEAIRCHFPKPKSLSLARMGGKEFAILFKANNENDARTQLDQCRISIASSTVKTPDIDLSASVSIGFSSLEGESEPALALAEQAKVIAQQLGRNRVEGYFKPMSPEDAASTAAA